MFDPERAEKEAREANPAFDAAKKRVEQEIHLYLEPVSAYFARLEEEITTMPIAERFRRDATPRLEFTSSRGILNPIFEDLNEADFKRAQLRSDLQDLRAKAMSLTSNVEGLVMDMLATQQD